MSGPKYRPNHHPLWVSLALCAPISWLTGSGPETQTVLLSLNQGCFPVPSPGPGSLIYLAVTTQGHDFWFCYLQGEHLFFMGFPIMRAQCVTQKC